MDIILESSNEQKHIDKNNEKFWDELCGSSLAKHLNIVDSSKASLSIFDNYYFGFYPYLKKYIPKELIENKNVLEVGLGYGTLSEYLATNSKSYAGLDIATNPIKMAAQRLANNNVVGKLTKASMLNCPYNEEYFDTVISIGCYHHTGNMKQCIDETYRVLKQNGTAIIMVYNKYSLRQWIKWPILTFKSLLSETLRRSTMSNKPTEEQRAAYDARADATEAAPETTFFSKKEIFKMLSKFSEVKITRENFDDHLTLKLKKLTIMDFGPREKILNTFWTKIFGLDLYIVAKK